MNDNVFELETIKEVDIALDTCVRLIKSSGFNNKIECMVDDLLDKRLELMKTNDD